jgi:hypothetical protein
MVMRGGSGRRPTQSTSSMSVRAGP